MTNRTTRTTAAPADHRPPATDHCGAFAALLALMLVAAPALATNSIVVSRDDNGGILGAAYVGPSDPANYNDFPTEVVISGDEDGPYTVTFQSGVVSHDPADGDTLYRIFTLSSLDDHELIVTSVSVSSKDVGIWLDRPFTSNPAKFKKLNVDFSNCRSGQIVDSAIVGGLKQVNLPYHASGPTNAGRCELYVGANITAAAADISCHDYKLEVEGAILKDVDCTGDLTGFIKTLGDTASTGNIAITGDLTGSVELTVMEGDILADNFTSTSTITLDEMSGEIKADDGASAGDIAGTITCTGDWSQFSGKITATEDIAATANITIDLLDAAAQVKATDDLLGELTIGLAAGTFGADDDVTGKITVTSMDGNLIADNLAAATCIESTLAANSDVHWWNLGQINGAAVHDSTANNGIQDECASNAPLSASDDDDDGVTDGADNCPMDPNPANSGAKDCNLDGDTSDPGEASGQQCDQDHDGFGDECDRCIGTFNQTQCDTFEHIDYDGDGTTDGDGTGDACDSYLNRKDFNSTADRDNDGDVDGVDFSKFAACFNKAGNPPRTAGCKPAARKPPPDEPA